MFQMLDKSAFLAAAVGAVLLNVLLLAVPAAEDDLPWTALSANAVVLVLDTVSDTTVTASDSTNDLPWT
jgi:hypothetical protein